MEKKTVVLGVTGGIAAYKSAEIASRLRKAGVEVYVIMTEHATEFIAPLTFETLTDTPWLWTCLRKRCGLRWSTSPWPSGPMCS